MKHGAQKDIFKTIPGLENSKFARLGGLHRNTFIKSPKLLDPFLRLKSSQNVIFAGQITGVEGYVESTAIGFLAGIIAAYDLKNKKLKLPPENTAHGALLKHITMNANPDTFQPMNINFGLMPDINLDLNNKKRIKGREKKKIQSNTAINSFKEWIKRINF